MTEVAIAPSFNRAATKHRAVAGRKLRSSLGWAFCGICFLLVAAPLIDIILLVLVRGFSALSVDLLTQVTQGVSGGLLNAIEGTIVLSIGALIIGVPIGVGAGVYLSEFGDGRFGQTVRFLADVLTGVPSIVLGYFSYVTMVIWLGWQFSVLAASITLAIMILPYMAKMTELVLRQIPIPMREAAYALGAGDRKVVLRVLLPVALPGILTAVLLSLAISVGETAPLIYTAGWSNYLWDGKLVRSPIGYLTYVIWSFINQPFASAHALAFAAALLVMMTVLAINLAARAILRVRGG
ncbi:phosphate ABC transporter permease PstA [Acidisoma cellulosilytica]|uniref:Phosphate transport system permease protein PstA n=1 Tax=Acidisoma cellulosilyticum TaxID=2802395 RepID=A0A964E373_9PROT|nr:phosphate ABC transporter permease PstA [Acidisoma cellulosilyticum]MCB8880395.1 phosphate ABC transporter permease PstA [Acidisoma cellulosilyticum]